EIGYNILEPINFLKESLPIVRHHHEWYNGQGYPDGLKETEIPYEAAIFSIIDVYDALTSDRHYRKKFSHEKALEIITEGINTQFVPNLTEEVLTIIDKYYEISNENKQIDEFSEPGDDVQ
ncbi:MAG: HD domain-containing protein, partial [Candidatus Jettenia caeni]|nr:HD domain-containing protein [Candidatus Jettenia caeni]